METSKLLEKLRPIKVKANRLANEHMAGAYRSVFKGRGMSFEEVRPYQDGDDIRVIDWNVSARSRDLFVKLFVEERELTFFLVLDMSRSAAFGSRGMERKELIAQVAAAHAFAAIKNNDRVGLIIHTDRVAHFVPPKKGVTHVLRVIRDILEFEPKGGSGDAGEGLSAAVRYLMSVTKKTVNAVLISDFFVPDKRLPDVERALSLARQRHDLTAFFAMDPLDDPKARGENMPAAGLVELEDLETGAARLVDLSSRSVRERYGRQASAGRARVETLFKKLSIHYEHVWTDRDWVPPVNRLYLRKAKRKH
jgi:uncharacterized protein (DUF58 family)